MRPKDGLFWEKGCINNSEPQGGFTALAFALMLKFIHNAQCYFAFTVDHFCWKLCQICAKFERKLDCWRGMIEKTVHRNRWF